MPVIVDIGSAPARGRITITRGDSFDLPIIVKENGTPKDLTGYTTIGEIRDADDALVVAFTFAGNDLPNGLIVPHIDKADTLPLDECTEYSFGVAIETGATARDTLLGGPVRVLEERVT